MAGVQTVEVEEDAQDMRLDRWFRGRFPHVSQGRIEKMCRKGEIRVDGGRVRAATRLNPGQTVRIPPLPEAGPKPSAPTQPAALPQNEVTRLRAAVLFEDDHLIALNKPAGLAVQGGSRTPIHLDMLSAALVPEGAPKPKLIHRLDRDTSGVLVLAKTGRAAAALAKSFQSRATRKIYWAAVAGVPHPRAGSIRYGLVKAPGHGPHGAGEKMNCIHPDQVDQTQGAKRALTDFMTLETAARRAAWVALTPITGRTHQLRAHMAQIGAPIVGDGKYGTNRQTNEGDGWGAQLGGDVSRKLHLHARHLQLPHPITGNTLSLTADLPEHMARTWDLMAWDPRDVPADPFEQERL